MRTAQATTILLMLAALLLGQPAQAIVISFSPVSQSTTPGASVTVDLLVSGLHDPTPNEIVSSYDFNVRYDSAILAPSGVSFGSALGGPADSFQVFDISVPGLIDLAEFSFLDDATLDALQGDSIRLATLNFISAGLGSSGFIVEQNALFVLTGRADATGIPQTLAPLTVEAGSVLVAQTNQIPTPPTLALFTLGLALLLRGRHQHRKFVKPCQIAAV